jgi:hypothetical protein
MIMAQGKMIQTISSEYSWISPPFMWHRDDDDDDDDDTIRTAVGRPPSGQRRFSSFSSIAVGNMKYMSKNMQVAQTNMQVSVHASMPPKTWHRKKPPHRHCRHVSRRIARVSRVYHLILALLLAIARSTLVILPASRDSRRCCCAFW